MQEFFEQIGDNFSFFPVIMIQAQDKYSDQFFLRINAVLSAIRLINKNSVKIPFFIFSRETPEVLRLLCNFKAGNLQDIFELIKAEKYGSNNIEDALIHVRNYAVLNGFTVAFLFTCVPVSLFVKKTGIPLFIIEVFDYCSVNRISENFTTFEIEKYIPKDVKKIGEFIFELFNPVLKFRLVNNKAYYESFYRDLFG